MAQDKVILQITIDDEKDKAAAMMSCLTQVQNAFAASPNNLEWEDRKIVAHWFLERYESGGYR